MKMVGKTDQKTIKLASLYGINIRGGAVNKTDGRVRIFVKGKFPAAPETGGSMRSRVVWWLNTGEVLRGIEFNIHHKNHDRTDDRFCNLEKISHVNHAHHHNPKTVEMVTCECKECGTLFSIEKWRLKNKSRGQFCSQSCYHTRRSPQHRLAISNGLRVAHAEGRR